MKITKTREFDEPQPAIDTQCDNCGAIYDREDCATCSCGKTLCPDCKCENLQYISLVPDFKSLSN